MSRPSPELHLEPPVESSVGELLGRRYSGLESSQRAMERHRRLIAAGVEVFGTLGYSGAKIKTLCKSAGLSERYFYESFESREHLLGTVFNHLDALLTEQIAGALQAPGMDLLASARAGMEAVVNFMLNDPRHARIMLVEVVGVSPELEAKRHQSMSDFADESLQLLLLLSGIDPVHGQEQLTAKLGVVEAARIFEGARLTAVSMVGGVNNMMLDALLSGTTHDTERISDVAFQLIYNASQGVRALAEKP
ncbi:TetR/AcrR family transcriptional regulator [Arthrobacter glacialis]|uniref:TetR/AcrR family transcriptional regulator n=1 Tax=Arthrobacter glacialis TaxID=1664 RepID=UPI00105738D8|nr:TetR/AcrR family transcriptional regulator [Arthrobacter glacialis]